MAYRSPGNKVIECHRYTQPNAARLQRPQVWNVARLRQILQQTFSTLFAAYGGSHWVCVCNRVSRQKITAQVAVFEVKFVHELAKSRSRVLDVNSAGRIHLVDVTLRGFTGRCRL